MKLLHAFSYFLIVFGLSTTASDIKDIYDYYLTKKPSESYDIIVSLINVNDALVAKQISNKIEDLTTRIENHERGVNDINSLILEIEDELLAFSEQDLLNPNEYPLSDVPGLSDFPDDMYIVDRKCQSWVKRDRCLNGLQREDWIKDKYIIDELIDLELIQWEGSSAYYYDENAERYRYWRKYYGDKYGYLSDSKKKQPHHMLRQGLYLHEYLITYLTVMCLDFDQLIENAKISESFDSFAKTDLPMNQDHINMLSNNSHEYLNCLQTIVGNEFNLSSIKISSRDNDDGDESLSLIYKKADVAMPYIVLMKDTEGISFCAIRTYYENGNLKHYAYIERPSDGDCDFLFIKYHTGLDNSIPKTEDFDFNIEDGWEWMDKTGSGNSDTVAFHNRDKTIEQIPVVDPRKDLGSLGSSKKILLFFIYIVFITIVVVSIGIKIGKSRR